MRESERRSTDLNSSRSFTGVNKKSFQVFLDKQLEAIHSDDSEEEPHEDTLDTEKFTFEQTKITIAIVGKFYLQWFLLLFIHAFVFFYFPITGNEKLNGT
mmetsp:Transcript_42750/g.41094  ORF Transcript_42750/g.41094 Transcript_42750/m.41094 type:complete len:100 (-) Transcript_42750:747-1046(-)